ncbi:hypothetical protein [Promicromonospora sp. NPDC060271]|uniref:hypothetical protein n=1 Tax=Promicromonospora sp. NPDC060271 TaxID=3347089 RepID=UPI003664F182
MTNSSIQKPGRTRERIGLVAVTAVLTAAATIGITGVATADDRAGAKDTAGQTGKKTGEPTEQEIAALFDEWNAALGTGDAEAVADRYAHDGVLLPTVSG